MGEIGHNWVFLKDRKGWRVLARCYTTSFNLVMVPVRHRGDVPRCKETPSK